MRFISFPAFVSIHQFRNQITSYCVRVIELWIIINKMFLFIYPFKVHLIQVIVMPVSVQGVRRVEMIAPLIICVWSLAALPMHPRIRWTLRWCPSPWCETNARAASPAKWFRNEATKTFIAKLMVRSRNAYVTVRMEILVWSWGHQLKSVPPLRLQAAMARLHCHFRYPYGILVNRYLMS